MWRLDVCDLRPQLPFPLDMTDGLNYATLRALCQAEPKVLAEFA